MYSGFRLAYIEQPDLGPCKFIVSNRDIGKLSFWHGWSSSDAIQNSHGIWGPFILDNDGGWKYLIISKALISLAGVFFIYETIEDTTYLTDKLKKQEIFSNE